MINYTTMMSKIYKCASCTEQFPIKELERHFVEYHTWN